jgi:hypothetical protein
METISNRQITEMGGKRHGGSMAIRILAITLLLVCLFSYSHFAKNGNSVNLISEDCFDAARKILGAEAQVAKYGNLLKKKSIEVVAYTKLNTSKTGSKGISASRLVVLQKTNTHWDIILDASKQIKNQSGFIGIEYIDDSQDYPGYLVSFFDKRSDGVSGFSIQLSYLRRDGEVEGIPIEISWNPAVDRFQEFVINEAPEGFRNEIKNPPHIHKK